jgi:hypothetical protein
VGLRFICSEEVEMDALENMVGKSKEQDDYLAEKFKFY